MCFNTITTATSSIQNTSVGRSKSEPRLRNYSIFFNRENSSREIQNRFPLPFSTLTKESTRISASSSFATFPRDVSEKKEASQCCWPSLCEEKLMEEQNIEEDFLPGSTSSFSQQHLPFTLSIFQQQLLVICHMNMLWILWAWSSWANLKPIWKTCLSRKAKEMTCNIVDTICSTWQLHELSFYQLSYFIIIQSLQFSWCCFLSVGLEYSDFQSVFPLFSVFLWFQSKVEVKQPFKWKAPWHIPVQLQRSGSSGIDE